MKNKNYSAKTFISINGKLQIAGDKIFDAIDIVRNGVTPYRVMHDQMIEKKLQKIVDMIEDTMDQLELIDNKYYK